jgi:opacity protein-like surface antigen
MKKILIFLSIISFGTGCVFAQKGHYIQVSIQPGTSFILGEKFSKKSIGYTNASIDKDFTFSFQGGINGGYNFTKYFGLSVGVLYSVQGQKYKKVKLVDSSDSTVFYLKNKVNLSYLKIPLRLHCNTDPEKPVSFTCYAGVYLDVLLAYRDTYNKTHDDLYYNQVIEGDEIRVDYGNGQKGYGSSYELVGMPFKSINFGLTAGAGIQTKLSEKLALQIMIDYELGFSDIKNLKCKYSPSTDPNRSVVNRNSVCGLMIGLKKTFK